jgi:guanylate kinase
MSGKLIVLAGPSAVGKGTIAKHIVANHSNFHLSISATTRSPRSGEVEGESYFFVPEAEFQRLIDSGQMLEWAVVHGTNLYGTPRKPVETALLAGKNVILEIDVQGARQVRASFPEAILVFVEPPSFEILSIRMDQRGTETPGDKARRLETARAELATRGEFDYVVVNDQVAKCAQQVVDLVETN